MDKIFIFGNSGSGKSTLAMKLANQLQLTHLDLDTLAWQATNPPTRQPLEESQKQIENFIELNPSWVIEGCYADLLKRVEHHASHAIFMDLPIALCLQNAKNRPWESHKYISKAEQDANLPMLLDWVADYTDRKGPFSYQAHESL